MQVKTVRLVALLCAAQFVVVLDTTIVAVALPAIRDDLGFSAAGLQWVVSAYGLTFGGFLMLLGRAADLAGRRRVLVAGFALFGAASLACGLAPSPAALIAARAVQGIGAAAVSPAALSLLVAEIPEGARRTKALAAWTAAAAGGGALGWVLGGAITETLGWEWVFLVNVAPCALAAALIRATVPESHGPRQRLDVPGALACTAGLALVIVGLSHDLPWIVAGTAVLAAFAAIERRVREPLLPPRTFRNAQLRDAVITSVVITTASTGPLFLCVLYLQDQLQQGASAAGLLFAPVNLAVIAGSVTATRLDRRRATAVGLVLLGAGAAALLTLPDHPPVPATLTLAFVAIGGGIGAAALGATSAGTAAADEDHRGLASGLLNTGAQLGNALGPAVCVPLAAAAGAKAAFAAAAALAGIAALWSVR